MSETTLKIKQNSVHPAPLDENNAIKAMKRTKKRPLNRKHSNTTRVPDETMNLEDTVFNVDTSVLLVIIGLFKLLLLTPLLVVGVVLVSMKTSERNRFNETANDSLMNNRSSANAMTTAQSTSTNTLSWSYYENLFNIRNDSVAPIWTAVMLAGSSAMDFISARQRAGNTIIVYMLIATVAFVACILCIEYDRIEIKSIAMLMEKGFYTLELHRKLYVTCVVIASIGVAIGLLSIWVGSRMAELEQSRLYMERDGLPAVLTKKDGRIRRIALSLARRFMSKCGDREVVDTSAESETMTIHESNHENDRNFTSQH